MQDQPTGPTRDTRDKIPLLNTEIKLSRALGFKLETHYWYFYTCSFIIHTFLYLNT